MAEVTLTEREALEALNRLRSNVVATQNAGWSNLVYPLVAILNAAGFELDEHVTEDAEEEHLATYGGAGGWPGQPVDGLCTKRYMGFACSLDAGHEEDHDFRVYGPSYEGKKVPRS